MVKENKKQTMKCVVCDDCEDKQVRQVKLLPTTIDTIKQDMVEVENLTIRTT